jgi:hypothetical protein
MGMDNFLAFSLVPLSLFLFILLVTIEETVKSPNVVMPVKTGIQNPLK